MAQEETEKDISTRK